MAYKQGYLPPSPDRFKPKKKERTKIKPSGLSKPGKESLPPPSEKDAVLELREEDKQKEEIIELTPEYEIDDEVTSEDIIEDEEKDQKSKQADSKPPLLPQERKKLIEKRRSSLTIPKNTPKELKIIAEEYIKEGREKVLNSTERKFLLAKINDIALKETYEKIKGDQREPSSSGIKEMRELLDKITVTL